MSRTVVRKTKTKSESSSSRTRRPADHATILDEGKEESKIHGFFAPAKKRQREETTTDQHDQVDYFHVITYNTDGLDDNFLAERASEVCSIILGDSDLPDVVLLQEVCIFSMNEQDRLMAMHVFRLCRRQSGYLSVDFKLLATESWYLACASKMHRISLKYSSKTEKTSCLTTQPLVT